MSLIGVRERVARESGRHDLVSDFAAGTYTDSGNGVSTAFINDGQRLLDRKANFVKGYSWLKKDVTAGTYKLNFRYCSAVKEVWAMNASTDRYKLVKKDLSYIRKNYGDVYASLSQGDPEMYSPLVVNLAPDQIALTTTDYTDEFTYDYEEILFSDTADHFYYSGILWMPPVGETFTISILGRFWSPILSADADKTFWTEVHPDILALATMYCIERTYRNREGMADYMSAIMDAIGDIDRNLVEQEVQDKDSMEG